MNRARTLITIALAIVELFAVTEISVAARRRPRRPRHAPSPAERKLQLYARELEELLPAKVYDALAKIPDNSRRLLAVAYYLRRDRDEIEAKWAWTREEARAYRETVEYQEAVAEVDNVRKMFQEMNPGYELHVAIEIRSLASQIGKWNGTASVRNAAIELRDTCLALMADTTAGYTETPNEETILCFRALLETFEPTRIPTVAVPGLSQHGQLRAFDFRIRHRGRVVAGATASTIPTAWDATGWTDRLNLAVMTASCRFEGPLDTPYEPWHYTYHAGTIVEAPPTAVEIAPEQVKRASPSDTTSTPPVQGTR